MAASLGFLELMAALEDRLRAGRDRGFSSPDLTLDELDLDSLEQFEIVLAVEEIADILLPPADLPAIRTLGDLYSYYRAIAADGSPVR